MRWIDRERLRPVRAEALATLLAGAAGQAAQRPAWHIDRARAHERAGDYAAAAQSYEAAQHLDPPAFRAWPNLAAAYNKLRRHDLALAVGDRAGSPTAALVSEQARALRKLGREADAIAILRPVLAQDGAETAIAMLLRMLAIKDDGAMLLEVCDGLIPRYANTAFARAHRAIALSRVGRTADALAMVDLERHVVRIPFTPPAALGAPETFNRELAEEILADPSPYSPVRDNLELNWAPAAGRSPRFAALYDFIRSEMLRYIDDMPRRGLDSVLAPKPDAAHFSSFNVVLRKDGSNGEHVHALSYISAVYHVVVPRAVVQANDTRGALALGCCTSVTNGYAPCWGVRHIKPAAGWLTLFPAHFFHDVVPSRTDAPRISVAADLKPVRD